MLFKYILGEISVGKLMLINRIFDMRIFKGRNLEIILIIVKLRNLNRVEIIIESDIGVIKEIDLINECDFISKDGVKVLRDYLKNMIDRIVL